MVLRSRSALGVQASLAAYRAGWLAGGTTNTAAGGSRVVPGSTAGPGEAPAGSTGGGAD